MPFVAYGLGRPCGFSGCDEAMLAGAQRGTAQAIARRVGTAVVRKAGANKKRRRRRGCNEALEQPQEVVEGQVGWSRGSARTLKLSSRVWHASAGSRAMTKPRAALGPLG